MRRMENIAILLKALNFALFIAIFGLLTQPSFEEPFGTPRFCQFVEGHTTEAPFEVFECEKAGRVFGRIDPDQGYYIDWMWVAIGLLVLSFTNEAIGTYRTLQVGRPSSLAVWCGVYSAGFTFVMTFVLFWTEHRFESETHSYPSLWTYASYASVALFFSKFALLLIDYYWSDSLYEECTCLPIDKSTEAITTEETSNEQGQTTSPITSGSAQSSRSVRSTITTVSDYMFNKIPNSFEKIPEEVPEPKKSVSQGGFQMVGFGGIKIKSIPNVSTLDETEKSYSEC